MITDHHEVKLGVLECVTQEDDTSDDRIRVTYSADEGTYELVDLGDFDEGQDVNLSSHYNLGTNCARGEVKITIYDQDGADLEDDPTSGSALDNLGTVTIGDFAGAPSPTLEFVSYVTSFTQDGAHYRLEVSRQR